MALLKLQPAPKFRAKVAIPVPGGDPVPVEFEFVHRTKSDLEAFLASADKRPDVDSVMETVSGWELSDKFDRDNVARLLDNYHGAARAIAQVYLEQLMALRLGN